MKTGAPQALDQAAPIVRLTEVGPAHHTADGECESQVQRARAFAEPLLAAQPLDTGEDALEHADGVAQILQAIGAAPSMRAAAYLVYAADYLHKPEDVVTKAFGPLHASLVMHTRRLVQIQRAARAAQFADNALAGEQRATQTERVRKMLLAFSRDLRVVLLRLASRLQTLRFYAASKTPCPQTLAHESMQVFAPLANRLGIWQIKWEIEDLAFRFLQPAAYRQVAEWLDEKRVEREAQIDVFRQRIAEQLQLHQIDAEVHGRPKHLYSIWKKMQGKSLPFTRVLDLRALRVVVADVAQCYAALSFVHELLPPLSEEFDDYIARPKANGYQSLHTVVCDDGGRPVEVQIRTRAMHEHAEHGVAAHWAYKEAGAKGYAGAVSAGTDFDAQVAEARKGVLRQLLAWERDFAGQDGAANADSANFDDRIYVFTPQATVIELAAGATPIDFAYAVHTDLGHRCRGARVDGAMVSLNTPLANGQTVEVTASKDGGPSMDWLNAELGYLQSARSKAKVRAWFNARAEAETIARGREAVEKLLQRIGKTAIKLDDLAAQLGFKQADALFDVVGKDEFSLRTIETLLKPPEVAPSADDAIAQRVALPESDTAKGGVLVVGVESLLTTLSRCCRPAPPDAIGGYVTRGKGVAIHRHRCANFKQMAQRAPERVISVAWGAPRGGKEALYSVEVLVEAVERSGLLRDITEVFSKDRMNVTSVKTHSVKGTGETTAAMTFTVQLTDAARLSGVLTSVGQIAGVRNLRRK